MRKKELTGLVAIVGVGILFFLAHLSTAENLNEPSQEKESILELPPALEKVLRERLSEWRVPARSDFIGRWEGFLKAEQIPFVSWGDFDGDGCEDLALILIGARLWKVGVFIKVRDSYRLIELKGFPSGKSFFQDNPPQDFRLQTIKRKSDQAGGCRFDALVLSSLKNPDSLIQYCWNPRYDFFSVSRQNDMTD
jgi:hypothetical protein